MLEQRAYRSKDYENYRPTKSFLIILNFVEFIKRS